MVLIDVIADFAVVAVVVVVVRPIQRETSLENNCMENKIRIQAETSFREKNIAYEPIDVAAAAVKMTVAVHR